MRRQGFVLLSALWVLVVAGAIAAGGAAAGRDAVEGHRNRINSIRAYWRANACVERARFAVDRALGEATSVERDAVWRRVATLSSKVSDSTCAVRFVADGDRLDVNTASPSEMQRLFESLRLPEAQALAEALADWTDADSEPRDRGAEAAWYAGQERRMPRNGPIHSIDELRYIAGFEAIALDSVLGVDHARISLNTAPLSVIATLPGISAEALERLAAIRHAGDQVVDLLAFAESLSPASTDAVIGAFPELSRQATPDPDAWLIVAEGAAGLPPIAAAVELRLVRAQSRAAVVTRRVW